VTDDEPTENDPPESGGMNSVEHIAGTENFADPTPFKIDLHDAHTIRRELASVYRDMRSGRIEPQDGTRLAYVLDLLRKAYETGMLQDRLEFLERTLSFRRDQ
jgi:hypothetical protein